VGYYALRANCYTLAWGLGGRWRGAGRAGLVDAKGELVITFDHTPTMVGDLQHWQYDTFKAHWRNRTIEDAFITFSLKPDGGIERARMAAVSPRWPISVLIIRICC
jgi:Domain of unknown function (DUF3471)